MPTGDAIARCVLSTFETLPSKAKPRHQVNGSKEWVPLSGIVLSRGCRPIYPVSSGLTTDT